MNPESDVDYYTFRDHLAADIKKGDVAMDPRSLIEHARSCAGIDLAEAAEWVERFQRDAARHVERRGAK
jgi:hypothetical protein